MYVSDSSSGDGDGDDGGGSDNKIMVVAKDGNLANLYSIFDRISVNTCQIMLNQGTKIYQLAQP